MLPFTHQQFIFVFSVYNGAIWPLQPIVHAAGLLMLALLLRPSRGSDRYSLVLLAAMWIWTGLVYQIGFFSRINAMAMVFGAAFVLEGALLLEAALRRRIAFGTSRGLRRATGWALLIYSLLLYPLLGIALGADYFELPAFGLTPCPVTMTTVGVLPPGVQPGPTSPLRHSGHVGDCRRQRGWAATHATRLGVAADAGIARHSRGVRAPRGRWAQQHRAASWATHSPLVG